MEAPLGLSSGLFLTNRLRDLGSPYTSLDLAEVLGKTNKGYLERGRKGNRSESPLTIKLRIPLANLLTPL
jgi:hypothetical protein